MVALSRVAAIVAITLLASSQGAVHAQMGHRLKGSIRSEAGAPIAGATVRANVLSGFRGEPFAGQKEHTIMSTDKGEWNLPRHARRRTVAGVFSLEDGLAMKVSGGNVREQAAQPCGRDRTGPRQVRRPAARGSRRRAAAGIDAWLFPDCQSEGQPLLFSFQLTV